MTGEITVATIEERVAAGHPEWVEGDYWRDRSGTLWHLERMDYNMMVCALGWRKVDETV